MLKAVSECVYVYERTAYKNALYLATPMENIVFFSVLEYGNIFHKKKYMEKWFDFWCYIFEVWL